MDIALRDMFAGLALAGELAAQFDNETSRLMWEKGDYQKLAESCYDIADAMVAEREKKDKTNEVVIPEGPTSLQKNCISYWLPKLAENTNIRIPETHIMRTDCEIGRCLEGNIDSLSFQTFLKSLGKLCDLIGYPCFLRTGQTSGKHDWKDTCCLNSKGNLTGNVLALSEFSECAGFIGLPYDVWAVREMLPTVPLFHAFHGKMPITEEYRFFSINGKIQCRHPYWPASCIREPSVDDWKEKLEAAYATGTEQGEAFMQASLAIEAVPGDDWSVDVLWTENGWYVIGMALADQSYHDPSCVFAPGKEEMAEPIPAPKG